MTSQALFGILPAIIFPVATLQQLFVLCRQPDSRGVSVLTWALFGVANLGLYCYVGRFTEWQSILGQLVPASLNFLIALVAIWRRPVKV